MTIVPIGKLVIQVGEGKNREEYLHRFVSGLEEAVKEVVKRSIEAELEEEMTRALKRKQHGRSKKVSSAEKGAAICQKCGTQQVSQFWRNGHYRRGWIPVGGT